ncbi:NRDE-2, necessary for RNA interference-domain-containing protein [Amylocarpus encephaloides]|uniref:NRDE-2, necessary for RNA interference-domain-containing protein n=1 Tax=Amylocarpus encephaloides TaxID=45428 RepID=A0A9P7YFP4_9HELO|nr:NRDE-2, necessary for RNA interference-domain-containing protein [Amylocarpus encephaloides]
MSEAKSNVPKFGSFRPKITFPSGPRDDEQPERGASSHSRKKRVTPDREDTKHRHRHYHRHRRSKSRNTDRSRHESKIAIPQPEHQAELPGGSDIFIIDRVGDEKNLVYGSIHRYNIPLFYRAGAGNVLGKSSSVKIDRDYGDDKGIVLSNWRDSNGARREKYAFSKIVKEKPRRLRIRAGAAGEAFDFSKYDFVYLDDQGGRKRKRDHGDTGDSPSSDDETNYRSIHSKIKGTDQPVDGALQYVTESDASASEDRQGTISSSSVRRKNIVLSRRVEQHPEDIDSWLALIELQDGLLRAPDDRHRTTNAEMRSTAEVKIHMYDKALKQAVSLVDRERILVGLMQEGCKIWEKRVLVNRWEEISKENIDSLILWKSYLNFRKTTLSSFRFEETRDIFLGRIKLLSTSMVNASPDAISSMYQQIIYVLLRATIFLRESGFHELAIAIWQGLMELNFCGPKRDMPEKDKLTLLGDFWESEVPRVGEDGSQGFADFIKNSGASEAPPSLIDEVEGAVDNGNLFNGWARAERSRLIASSLPARTMDEVVEDDPFRVVLFSDITDFLISFPEGKNLHKSLFDAFLVFCRMPSSTALSDSESPTDAFTHGQLLEWNPKIILEKYNIPSIHGIDAPEIEPIVVPHSLLSNFATSHDTLFSSTSWFQRIDIWDDHYSSNHQPVSYKWFRNVLGQITKSFFRAYLAEFHLAFEWRNEPATIKKVAKGLLKQHPRSLRLYNAYGLIESAQGNRGITDGIFSAALGMATSASKNDDHSSIILWQSWVWTCLEESDDANALRLILSIPDGAVSKPTTTSSVALLKAKQHLCSSRDFLISSGELRHAIVYAELLALLEYLTANSSQETQSVVQGDITSAMGSFTNFSKTISDCGHLTSISHELLLQSAARLLYRHAQIGPFRPALLREHFSLFLTLFPRNTIFLSLYTWNESRLRIDNRVRNILQSTVLAPNHDTVSSRVSAIQYEISHGTKYSVRSAFEHALTSQACSASASLWRMYLLYVLTIPQFRSQAKDIWYRALRACPWVKELYILGFEELGELVSFQELKRTWRVMGEKELRVHVDLEERFENIEDVVEEARKSKSLAFR